MATIENKKGRKKRARKPKISAGNEDVSSSSAAMQLDGVNSCIPSSDCVHKSSGNSEKVIPLPAPTSEYFESKDPLRVDLQDEYGSRNVMVRALTQLPCP